MSDHIQIGDISPRVQYVGTGTEKVFTYTFPIFKAADLEVYVDGVLKALVTDYVITGAGGSSGGAVTFMTAPEAGAAVTLVRRLAIQRTSDFQASGEFRAKVINDELDFQTAALQQIEDDLERAIRLKRNDTAATLELPLAADRSNKLIGFDSDGNVTTSTQSLSDLEGSAEAALAAQVAQTAAEGARSGAETAETNAQASQIAAANAQIAAEAAADGVIYNNVTYVTNAQSPYTLNTHQNGELISVDTSSGAVTINLPSIASIGDGWRISVKKTTGDGNAITVASNGTDTIDAAINGIITAAASGATYIADTDGAPDDWTSVGFGAAAGNMIDERFVSGVDFTKNTTTQIILSGSPGTASNIWISFDGVWQHSDDYSLSGSTLTFSEVIPADEVFVKYGTTVSVGTPADGSVGTVQLIDDSVTTNKVADGVLTQSFIIALSDETSDLEIGTARATMRMPYAFTLSEIPRASVTTAPTGSALTVDVNEDGLSILSTKLTIDPGEKTSTTAANPSVLFNSTLADEAEITFDIDGIGSTIAGAGLKVTMIGHKS